MLGWSQQKLADESEIARSTLALIEKRHDDVNNASRAKVQKKLEEQGIEFLVSEAGRGEGIWLRAYETE
jgi:transcriptional regulator with XRE-family HTH domain